MSIYPEQLRGIAKLCEALNAADEFLTADHLTVESGIKLVDDDGVLYGELVDEIGGVWSFEPAKRG